MKILYKLTSRSRPYKMFNCIENIRESADEKDPWIIVTLDTSDANSTAMHVRKRLRQYPNVHPVYGFSRNKIDAMNRDIPAEGWDIVVATSDDIQFSKGFDLHIESDASHAALQLNQEAFSKEGITNSMYYSDMDFTIWYPDGAPHGKIITVPILTNKYYNRLGYVYNPVYANLWCDEEAIHVGEKLGKIFYSTNDIMTHLHPAWGKGTWDPQYRKSDSHYYKEKIIFDDRKIQGFPVYDRFLKKIV